MSSTRDFQEVLDIRASNLDLAPRIFADWERGDFSSVEWAHPEIALVIAEGFEPGSWTGVSAWMEWRDDYLSAWEDFSLKAEQYRELDDERVLGSIRRLSKHPHITRKTIAAAEYA